MENLASFTSQIAARLQRARLEPRWDDAAVNEYMDQVGGRHDLFDQESKYLISTVIKPRLDCAVENFANACAEISRPGNSCRAQFGYCERFPVTAKVEFSIEHDVSWNLHQVRYEAYMMPLFIKFNEHDRLTLPVEVVMQRQAAQSPDLTFQPDEMIDHSVANWVETRLLEFLDAYLQIDRGDDSFSQDIGTDPVCGMRLTRMQSLQTDYGGHQYFFCSPECVSAFQQQPKKIYQLPDDVAKMPTRDDTLAGQHVPTLQFLGAAGTVTGSKFLLRANGLQVLIDCGLFQGPKALRALNRNNHYLEAKKLDAVVLTHAHIDHCGLLPYLTKTGFRGPVYCTPATKSLMQILLPDAAHLQAEEARYLNRKRSARDDPPVEPLYNSRDAQAALGNVKTQPYGEEFPIGQGLFVMLRRAGHILGSAILQIRIQGPKPITLAVSGDLGRWGRPMIRDPELISQADVLLVESTYGNRWHAPGDARERWRA